MRSSRLRTWTSAPLVLLSLAAQVFAADGHLQRGEILNPWELHNEIHVDASAAPAVKQYFLTFLDYQDLVLFHPTLGYYSSGRVNFSSDYRTFPDALHPYFGDMIAEQILKMWDGMRKAGTLAPTDRFTIAEFGAGDGALAESILEYIDSRAHEDQTWRDFSNQLVYACYDRSPALSAAQKKRNGRFGARFDAREGDATDPTATIAAGSLKGVVLSNELPDAFSVHKVVLGLNGSAEVGYVAPALSNSGWRKLEGSMPAELQQRLKSENQQIQARVFGKQHDNITYLSRDGFVALLEAVSKDADYTRKVEAIDFHEMYVPIETVPELAAHIRRYIPDYAYELARSGRGFAAYINLGEGRFMQGAGKILKAGYVVTIDYGENWDGVTPLQYDHLRTYGPGSRVERSDPYHTPTLNDITTDVNFSHVMEEGKAGGLRAVFFGPQHTLISGTSVNLEILPPEINAAGPDEIDDYKKWVQDFYTWDVFKVLIEQKEGTDAVYAFPGAQDAETLNVQVQSLPEPQQAKERQIEEALRERLK